MLRATRPVGADGADDARREKLRTCKLRTVPGWRADHVGSTYCCGGVPELGCAAAPRGLQDETGMLRARDFPYPIAVAPFIAPCLVQSAALVVARSVTGAGELASDDAAIEALGDCAGLCRDPARDRRLPADPRFIGDKIARPQGAASPHHRGIGRASPSASIAASSLASSASAVSRPCNHQGQRPEPDHGQ